MKSLDRAMASHRAGELVRAAELYDEALRVRPDHFDALHMLGLVRLQQKRFGEAFTLLQEASALRPDQVSASMHGALALENLGRHAEALDLFDRVLRRAPDHAATLNNRAKMLMSLGRLEEAVEGFVRALEIEPGLVDAAFNWGVALSKLGAFDEALAKFDFALALAPAFAPALVNKAGLMRRRKDYASALACLDAAAAASPRDGAIRANCADIWLRLCRPQQALQACKAALALEPDRHEALNNQGLALRALQRPLEALASFEGAIAVRPDGAEAHFNRGMTLASLGRWPEAWREMEWRKRTPERVGFKALDRPEWSGDAPTAGKRLFVHWEQGLGDTLQFCRFLRGLRRMGATVLFSAQRPLAALLKTLDAGIEFLDENEIPVAFDLHAPLLSLPFALRADVGAMSAQTPYLRADPRRVARWRAHVGAGGVKIGVCWEGSRAGAEMGKSAPPGAFEALACVPSVRLISLQKDPSSPPPDWMESLGADFDAGPDGFLDTAAVMHALDLVVTVDTSIAHLAGALCRPVWVLLPPSPDWRWGLERSDSFWYSSMRLIRRMPAEDWFGVGRRAANSLSRHISGQAHVR